jgi:hypothetical protein
MTDTFLHRREFLTKRIVGGAVGLGGLGAMAASQLAKLPVKSRLLAMEDKTSIHRVSKIKIEVKNEYSKSIDLRFSTIRDGLQTRFYWEVDSNTTVVRPGETQVFELSATNPRMSIPYDSSFILLIENIEANMGQTRTYRGKAPPELLPVRNPRFNNWVTRIGNTAPFPFRWDLVSETRANDKTDIYQGESGVNLRAIRKRRDGPWTMAGLSQRVPALSSVSVAATPKALSKLPKIRSGPVCGLEIVDRTHRIWLVFTDVDERRSEYIGGELDYHVEYLPATQGTVVDATVNLTRIYDEREWGYPIIKQYRVDGISYEASTLILHPFAAVYTDGERAAVEFHKVDGSQ